MIKKSIKTILHFFSQSKLHNITSNYYIKHGYKANERPQYFNDILVDDKGIVHQPDVYPYAAFLSRRLNAMHVIDIGCGRANKLTSLHPEFKIIGIDHGSNIAFCKDKYPFGQWVEWNLEKGKIPLKKSLLNNSVIICADVIEHLTKPTNLLVNIRECLKYAAAAIITTPERDLVRGVEDFGPPLNLSHIREWNLHEMEELLKSVGLRIQFKGLTNNNNYNLEKKTALFVLGNNNETILHVPPHDFRVVAFMTAYNEADIIIPSISYLINQGIEVYLIDNWSTDNTYELASQLLGKGLIGIEKYPANGPSPYYDLERLLGRVEVLASEFNADWFIHHDVDEIRESPWPGVNLRDAIYNVDYLGFNAIDHTVIVFNPIDNNYLPGSNFNDYYSYFEFGTRPGHFVQIKAWKNLGQQITLKESGGHNVSFTGRRVYPFNFLLKHYPIRSQQHGEKKVFWERQQRTNPEEKKKGWHIQYDSFTSGYEFIKNTNSLIRFDKSNYYANYLLERLSGIGIARND